MRLIFGAATDKCIYPKPQTLNRSHTCKLLLNPKPKPETLHILANYTDAQKPNKHTCRNEIYMVFIFTYLHTEHTHINKNTLAYADDADLLVL